MKCENEANNVLYHLGVTIRVSGIKPTRIDTEIGWGRSTTHRLLAKKIDLKIRHVLEILAVCKVPPSQFFAAVFREGGALASANPRVIPTAATIASVAAGLRAPLQQELVSHLQGFLREVADQLPLAWAQPGQPPP